MRPVKVAQLGVLLILGGCSQSDEPEQGVDTTITEDVVDEENASSASSILAGAGLELSSDLTMNDASTCRFDDTTERAFDKLLSYDWETDKATSANSVRIADRDLKTVKSETSEPSYPGSRIITASARFSKGTTWNNLKISRIIKEIGIFPDSDGYDTREISFLNTPSEVQNELSRIGIEVPVSPGYRELIDDGCGGSMQIKGIDGGAALSCGFGC